MKSTAKDALDELLVHVHGDGEVPEAWVAAHAPDGSLEALWTRCEHVGLLMNVAALALDHPTLVRAACACARLVVKHLPVERQQEADAALDAAERWARGEVDLDELAAAAEAVEHTYANAEPLVPLLATAAAAVDAAVSTAATAAGLDTRWYDTRQTTEAAGHAVLCAAGALDWADPNGGEGKSDIELCPLLAAVLREHLPCPTLDQVRRGFEEMLERDL